MRMRMKMKMKMKTKTSGEPVPVEDLPQLPETLIPPEVTAVLLKIQESKAEQVNCTAGVCTVYCVLCSAVQYSSVQYSVV